MSSGFLPPSDAPPAPLLIFGRLTAAVDHLRKQLRHIPEARHDYHGTLRTMATAACSVTTDIAMLIELYDSQRSGRVVDSQFEDVPVPSPVAAAEPTTAPVPEPVKLTRHTPEAAHRKRRIADEKKQQETSATEQPSAREHLTVREQIVNVLKHGPQRVAQIRGLLERSGTNIETHQVEQHCYLLQKSRLATYDEDRQLWSLVA